MLDGRVLDVAVQLSEVLRVAEAWLVNLDSSRAEIHRSPGGAGHPDVRVARADEAFSPAAFPDLTVTLRDLLG